MKKSKGVALLLFGMLTAQCMPLTAGATEKVPVYACENKVTANMNAYPYRGTLGKQVNLINWESLRHNNQPKIWQLDRRVNDGEWEHLGNISKKTDFIDRNITVPGTYQYRLKADNGDSVQGTAKVKKLTRFTKLRLKSKSLANQLTSKINFKSFSVFDGIKSKI